MKQKPSLTELGPMPNSIPRFPLCPANFLLIYSSVAEHVPDEVTESVPSVLCEMSQQKRCCQCV